MVEETELKNKPVNAIDIDLEDEDEKIEHKSDTSFPDAIREISKNLNKNYPERNTKFTNKNITGVIQIKVLQDYHESNFGYRFSVLDILTDEKQLRAVSKDGWMIEQFKEIIKGINATFEQTDLANRMGNLLKR